MKAACALSIERVYVLFRSVILVVRPAGFAHRHLGANQIVFGLWQIQPGAGGIRHDRRGSRTRNSRPRRAQQRAGAGSPRPSDRPLRPRQARAVSLIRQFSWPDGGRRGRRRARIRPRAPASGGLRTVQLSDGALYPPRNLRARPTWAFLLRASFFGRFSHSVF